MFDVFYSGKKPNLFPHEQEALSIEQAQQLSKTRYFWWINYLTDYADFDFLWEPVPWESHQRHAWPSQWQKDAGTYLIPKQGYTETNYRASPTLQRLPNETNWRGIGLIDISWHPDPAEPPLIYQFGTQWQKTGGPTYVVPGGVDVKYVEHPRVYKNIVDNNWTIPDSADTTTFDFTWHPDDTDPPYIYQFGTQHQRTGGPQYCVPGATDTKYVDQIKIATRQVATAIYEIDHMDGNAGQIPNTTRTVRYFDNYLDTLKRIAKNCNEEFIWICSSVCDYSNFDFTWHPEQWQAAMLHVFASDGEKFGDTFFMHVPTFKYRADRCQLLDWYDLNFTDKNVPRRALPVIKHTYDTHVEAVKNIDFTGPLAIYTTQDVVDNLSVPPVPLWREKVKTIMPLSPGASVCVVPKASVPYIKKQLYDYPNIDRTQRHMQIDEPLDIVFIDNGEPNAEANWNILKQCHLFTSQRIERSSGVNGRVAAYHAAAELSTTPWFFAVFAKLRVDPQFNWAWQPDRLQEPKHYIFHAFNPINGLEYGHQAMIAYNRELVLNNPGVGLDFTLDSPHEVVPIRSGTAEYANSPWSAWRTAFRECIKLKASADVESQFRLNKWLTVAMGQPYGQYSIYGAEDAVEYYDAVAGDFAELKKSYDWEWLSTYALLKRNLTNG
jgi:hypothetical protein